MSLYRTERLRWVGGLVVILIVYTLYYLYFVDHQGYYDINRKLRHVIKFFATVSVYLLGTFHLGKIRQSWMNMLWHTIHLSLLCVIMGIGIYDWTFGMVGDAIKTMAATFQEFLISPVLYVGMGILDERLVALNKKII